MFTFHDWYIQAVTERKQYFASLSFKFGRRLQEHLTGLFIQQVMMMSYLTASLPLSFQAEQLREEHASRGLPTLASHITVHQTLLPYSALLGWLRQSEPQPFNDVMEVNSDITHLSCDIIVSCDLVHVSQMYVRSFRRVYEAEVHRFMTEVKTSLGGLVDLKRNKFLPKVNGS